MNTDELIQKSIEKAQKELDDFKAQAEQALQQINARVTYLQGKVDGLKALLEPDPDPVPPIDIPVQEETK